MRKGWYLGALTGIGNITEEQLQISCYTRINDTELYCALSKWKIKDQRSLLTMQSYWSNNEQNNLEHVQSVLIFFLRTVRPPMKEKESQSLFPLINCMTLTEQNFHPLSLVGHKWLQRWMDGFVMWQWTVSSWQALTSFSPPCSGPKPSLCMMPEQWVSRSLSDISVPDTGLKVNSWATGSVFFMLKMLHIKTAEVVPPLYWYIIPAAQFSDRLTASSQAKFTTTQFTLTYMPLPTTFFT